MSTICSTFRCKSKAHDNLVWFRHLQFQTRRTGRTRRTRQLGHFDNLLNNRAVQGPEHIQHVVRHLRHRSVEDLHVWRVLDPLLHGVLLNPSLQLRLLHQLRHAHAANEKGWWWWWWLWRLFWLFWLFLVVSGCFWLFLTMVNEASCPSENWRSTPDNLDECEKCGTPPKTPSAPP